MTAAMLAAYPERFAGGAIVAGVPYGCADTVAKALECMKPGIDQTPAEWRRRVRNSAGGDGRAPPVSIWHGDADERVVPRNRQELVEQWTAVHGIAGRPARHGRSGPLTREVYTDDAGVALVESVLVNGLGHAFPIRTESTSSCGEPGEFVASTEVCVAPLWRSVTGFTGEPQVIRGMAELQGEPGQPPRVLAIDGRETCFLKKFL